MSTCAEQFDASLVPDFDAATGDQGDTSAEVGSFAPFLKIKLGARWAELVVKVVELGVVLFTDVAILRMDDLVKIEWRRRFLVTEQGSWGQVRGGENRSLAKLPDAGGIEAEIVAGDFIGFPLSSHRLG